MASLKRVSHLSALSPIKEEDNDNLKKHKVSSSNFNRDSHFNNDYENSIKHNTKI